MHGPIWFASALFLVVSVKARPQAVQPLPAEQTHFSAEDETVKRPATIPPEVLAQLAQDPPVRKVMRGSDPLLKQPPATWFSASVVHLAGPDEKDLVVEAEGELAGANVTNFWIFRQLSGGAQLVLNGPAHDLTIMRSRWNGLLEIELDPATATKFHRVGLRFDGAHYTVFSDKWEDIR
jgi:hypothetical protein